MTSSNNKPLWLILSLFALGAIVVLLAQVAKQDSETDQVYQDSYLPVEQVQQGMEQ